MMMLEEAGVDVEGACVTGLCHHFRVDQLVGRQEVVGEETTGFHLLVQSRPITDHHPALRQGVRLSERGLQLGVSYQC